jgi:DNA-binding MarR family transcriptional regulator
MATKQTRPRPRWLNEAEHTAWMELLRVFVSIPAALEGQMRRDSGLGVYEYRILSVLAEQRSRTMGLKQLAAVTDGSLSRLSHAVTRLEKSGYVRRQVNSDDGRLTDAILTDAGRTKVVAAAPGHVAMVRELVFDALTDEQVAELSSLLSLIAKDTTHPIVEYHERTYRAPLR